MNELATTKVTTMRTSLLSVLLLASTASARDIAPVSYDDGSSDSFVVVYDETPIEFDLSLVPDLDGSGTLTPADTCGSVLMPAEGVFLGLDEGLDFDLAWSTASSLTGGALQSLEVGPGGLADGVYADLLVDGSTSSTIDLDFGMGRGSVMSPIGSLAVDLGTACDLNDPFADAKKEECFFKHVCVELCDKNRPKPPRGSRDGEGAYVLGCVVAELFLRGLEQPKKE
jgi:hypothetical protein